MPDLGDFEWGDAIALIALLLALGLAFLRFLEWRAAPKLRVDMDWLAAVGENTRLNVVVSNRGRSRGGVRALLLSPSDKHDPEQAFSFLPMLAELPATIDPGDMALFTFEVDPNAAHSFTQSLVDGRFTHLLLIDQSARVTAHPIPPRGQDSETRRNRYGRVAKR